eukprot:CAMPEP_0174338782 /NCGR_PEP_ID=MMETSP0810-20121108/23425_1 /TAXON_ID=73025 ORGANISM="Eutreptiella gymnastica-like, Strain CCMP1594" /NCGR_SAMPLE_ID=MMETSP0810 /ASSEMBLY_ACC=CAM_ASM_000659 /LENGTH=93 /DNA_ID=CAMNT_0015459101 /DNA_START=541 /DNA_END=822 /DNA_ORIENTATION=-
MGTEHESLIGKSRNLLHEIVVHLIGGALEKPATASNKQRVTREKRRNSPRALGLNEKHHMPFGVARGGNHRCWGQILRAPKQIKLVSFFNGHH